MRMVVGFTDRSRQQRRRLVRVALCIALLFALSCRKGALIQLEERGWHITGTGPSLELSFDGAPPAESTTLLARLRGPFSVRLNRMSSQVREWSTVPHLIGLRISDPTLTDLSPLRHLESLSKLDVSGTSVTDLSPIRQLENLRVLDLANTPVRDLSPVAELHKLESLSLRGTKVYDISPLQGITDLRTLDLRDTGVQDLSPLKNRKGLSVRR